MVRLSAEQRKGLKEQYKFPFAPLKDWGIRSYRVFVDVSGQRKRFLQERKEFHEKLETEGVDLEKLSELLCQEGISDFVSFYAERHKEIRDEIKKDIGDFNRMLRTAERVHGYTGLLKEVLEAYLEAAEEEWERWRARSAKYGKERRERGKEVEDKYLSQAMASIANFLEKQGIEKKNRRYLWTYGILYYLEVIKDKHLQDKNLVDILSMQKHRRYKQGYRKTTETIVDRVRKRVEEVEKTEKF